MLATVVVMPGGLMLLLTVALVVLLMRSERGQRLLAPLARRLPPRLRARARRVFDTLRGEKIFLPARSAIHT
jgi:hypothetical protein